jgi:hypothetical protein
MATAVGSMSRPNAERIATFYTATYLLLDLDGDGVQDGVVKLDGFSGNMTPSDFLL